MIRGDLLDKAVEAYGIIDGYVDNDNHYQAASDDTKRMLLAALGLPVDDSDAALEKLKALAAGDGRLLPKNLIIRQDDSGDALIHFHRPVEAALTWRIVFEKGDDLTGSLKKGERSITLSGVDIGYHRLFIETTEGRAEFNLTIAPHTAYEGENKAREWGVTVALFGLQSERNWGIGDYEDLALLCEKAAAAGADFVGVNPLHALFPKAPHIISPYSPSSREFLNVMHIAPDMMAEFTDSEAGRDALRHITETARFAAVRSAEFIDYSMVYGLKMLAFEAAFKLFSAYSDTHPRRVAFQAFRDKKGAGLSAHALYETLAEHFSEAGHPYYDWHHWPEAFWDPNGPAAQELAGIHKERVDFYCYLQWIASEQLMAAKARAEAAGMKTGLYLDLAVGMVPGGAEVWSNKAEIVRGVSMGAPGDAANPNGQNWHLAPLNPASMKDHNYALLRKTLRSVMSYAGMIRIDHILGMARSFWCSFDGATPGGYVTYPLDDLLNIIALESVRQKCRVVGEDLGTVPEGLRETLQSRGLMGCSLVLFEKADSGRYLAPHEYSERSLTSLANHDFPTTRGFWEERDLAWRVELGIGAEPEKIEQDRRQRVWDREGLLYVFGEEGLYIEGDPHQYSHATNRAAHVFLSKTNARSIAVQVEDLLAIAVQTNVPGTVTEQPNWRRKIPIPLNDIFDEENVVDIVTAINGNR